MEGEREQDGVNHRQSVYRNEGVHSSPTVSCATDCVVVARHRPCVGFAAHQEFTAATRLLAPLCTPLSPELRSAVGRIYLQAGLLDQALTEFNLVSESIANSATPSVSAVASPTNSPVPSRVGSQVSLVSEYQSQGSGGRRGNITQRHKNLVNMNAALMASAQGDWVRAEEILRGIVATNPNDYAVSNSFLFQACSPPSFFPSRRLAPAPDLCFTLLNLVSIWGSNLPQFRPARWRLCGNVVQRALVPEKCDIA